MEELHGIFPLCARPQTLIATTSCPLCLQRDKAAHCNAGEALPLTQPQASATTGWQRLELADPTRAQPSSVSLPGQVGWASPGSTWLFSPHCLHAFCSHLCSHITCVHPTPHIICIHPISPPHMTLHAPRSHPHIPSACPAPIPTPPMAPSLFPVSLQPPQVRAAAAPAPQPSPTHSPPPASLSSLLLACPTLLCPKPAPHTLLLPCNPIKQPRSARRSSSHIP